MIIEVARSGEYGGKLFENFPSKLFKQTLNNFDRMRSCHARKPLYSPYLTMKDVFHEFFLLVSLIVGNTFWRLLFYLGLTIQSP